MSVCLRNMRFCICRKANQQANLGLEGIDALAREVSVDLLLLQRHLVGLGLGQASADGACLQQACVSTKQTGR